MKTGLFIAVSSFEIIQFASFISKSLIAVGLWCMINKHFGYRKKCKRALNFARAELIYLKEIIQNLYKCFITRLKSFLFIKNSFENIKFEGYSKINMVE